MERQSEIQDQPDDLDERFENLEQAPINVPA